MSLFTKSILSEREAEDGVRISVMSRHTENDGITPHPKIIPRVSFDEHLVKLAPKSKLVGSYYREEIDWAEFELRYLEQIRQPDSSLLVQTLALRALNEDITLLCIEKLATRCHRRLLAEECLTYEPGLEIEHY